MVSISNDQGDTIQLATGQNLVTERAVAWLSDDELPGEFSYSIDLPLNENNKRFVMHGYRPDRALPFSDMPVTVRFDGVLYRRCTFSFRINEGRLSGFLKIDSAEFYDKIRNMTLLEALPTPIPLGDGLTGPSPVTFQTRLRQIAELPPGQFPCTFFPIRNEGFWESDFNGDKLPGFPTPTTDSYTILNQIKYVNAWERLESGGLGFPVDLPNLPSFGRAICPQFYLSYVLEQIMKLAGYRIESDWLASPEVQRLVVLNMTAMNQTFKNLGEVLAGHQLVPGLFLPDVTVSDFLKAIKGRYGLVFTYDGNARVCRITQFVRTIRAGAAIDLTPYQAGSYSTDFAQNTGYKVKDLYDSGDELYKDSQGKALEAPTQLIGKGSTDVTLRAGTCQLIRVASQLSNTGFWFVPTVRQAGNTLDTAYKESGRYLTKEGKRPNSIGIRLLSYRGMTTDSAGNTYPFGTPDIYDGQQAAVGTLAQKMTGRAGLWRNVLRAYYYFRDQTQRITQPLLMPVDVLASLELHRPVWLSLEDHIRRSYLIQKLRADAPGPDGKVTVRLEALSLPSGIEQVADQDEPIVWIELIQVESNSSEVVNGRIIIRATLSLTVKCWQDATRTTPALVTNLPVILRSRQAWETYPVVNIQPEKLYEELQLTYLVNGTETQLETAFVSYYTELPGGNADIRWNRVVSLDPGEGYKIIS